nr:hypothetical protein [Sulfuriflexus mobilis]
MNRAAVFLGGMGKRIKILLIIVCAIKDGLSIIATLNDDQGWANTAGAWTDRSGERVRLVQAPRFRVVEVSHPPW